MALSSFAPIFQLGIRQFYVGESMGNTTIPDAKCVNLVFGGDLVWLRLLQHYKSKMAKSSQKSIGIIFTIVVIYT